MNEQEYHIKLDKLVRVHRMAYWDMVKYGGSSYRDKWKKSGKDIDALVRDYDKKIRELTKQLHGEQEG